MKMLNKLYVANLNDWRSWLEANHTTETEVWLIYYKKHTGKPRISYSDAVEEALCYGWIDSLVKKIDEEKYAQKFTPRKDRSKWSILNKKRVKKLIEENRMTEAGLKKIHYDITKSFKENIKQKKAIIIPNELKKILMTNKEAWKNFNKLAPSYRQNYIGWIMSAKKEETRQRRLKEAMDLLVKNKKIGMK